MYNMTNLQPMGCMQPCTASPAATLCTTPSWQWLCLAKRLGSAPGTHNNQTWVCDWHCLGWSHDTGRAQCSSDSSDSKLFCCPEHARLSPFHSSPLGIRVDEISPSHTAGSGGKGWKRTAYTTLEIQQFLMIALPLVACGVSVCFASLRYCLTPEWLHSGWEPPFLCPLDSFLQASHRKGHGPQLPTAMFLSPCYTQNPIPMATFHSKPYIYKDPMSRTSVAEPKQTVIVGVQERHTSFSFPYWGWTTHPSRRGSWWKGIMASSPWRWTCLTVMESPWRWLYLQRMTCLEPEKGRPGELQAGEPHLCPREDHGADPPRSYVKAHTRQKGDLRQPVWLHHGQIFPDQSGQESRLLWWSDDFGGWEKGDGYHLPGLLQSL